MEDVITEMFNAHYKAKVIVEEMARKVRERGACLSSEEIGKLREAYDALSRLKINIFLAIRKSVPEQVMSRLYELVDEALRSVEDAIAEAENERCNYLRLYQLLENASAAIDSMLALLIAAASDYLGKRQPPGGRTIQGKWLAILALLGLGLAAAVLKKA